MPQLKGTERQVAWATNIRDRFTDRIKALEEAAAILRVTKHEVVETKVTRDILNRGAPGATSKRVVFQQELTYDQSRQLVSMANTRTLVEGKHTPLPQEHPSASSPGPAFAVASRLEAAMQYEALASWAKTVVKSKNQASWWIDKGHLLK